jgi:hypothetical protein
MTGCLNNMTPTYEACVKIIKKEGVEEQLYLATYTANNAVLTGSFQDACEKLADSVIRPKVKVGNKTYYEADLAKALAGIKEVPCGKS